MATASSSPLLPDPDQQPAGGAILTNPESGSSSSAWQSSGSIGPFCAVISVLTFLSILSCFLGRICRHRSDETQLSYSIKSRDCLSFFKKKFQRPRFKDVEQMGVIVKAKGVDLGELELKGGKVNKDGELQNISSSS